MHFQFLYFSPYILILLLLEHPQQMWDMCQMLNIWHISHTKPSLTPFIRCCKCYIFYNMLQYSHKFATVRYYVVYGFINFLFLSHSRISFIFSFSCSVFTASISISTLPFSFFFPLPCCSILFLFMNMSHHQFPLYHH